MTQSIKEFQEAYEAQTGHAQPTEEMKSIASELVDTFEEFECDIKFTDSASELRTNVDMRRSGSGDILALGLTATMMHTLANSLETGKTSRDGMKALRELLAGNIKVLDILLDAEGVDFEIEEESDTMKIASEKEVKGAFEKLKDLLG